MSVACGFLSEIVLTENPEHKFFLEGQGSR